MKNKWLKLNIIPLSISSFIFSKIAMAANLRDAFPNAKIVASSTYNTSQDLYPMLGNIIAVILSLLGAIFIIFIIYGGYIWMTASGNEQKDEKATQIIKETIIGLIVILGAYAISYFILSLFSSQLKNL
jgi:beta-lactamase regulating signal transducer with metallopeptidase domain